MLKSGNCMSRTNYSIQQYKISMQFYLQWYKLIKIKRSVIRQMKLG